MQKYFFFLTSENYLAEIGVLDPLTCLPKSHVCHVGIISSAQRTDSQSVAIEPVLPSDSACFRRRNRHYCTIKQALLQNIGLHATTWNYSFRIIRSQKFLHKTCQNRMFLLPLHKINRTQEAQSKALFPLVCIILCHK